MEEQWMSGEDRRGSRSCLVHGGTIRSVLLATVPLLLCSHPLAQVVDGVPKLMLVGVAFSRTDKVQ